MPAAIRPFRTVQTPDRVLNLIQDSLGETLDSITRNVVLNGQFIKQAAFVAGANTVSHGLGRNYLSFFLGGFTNKNNLAAASIYATLSPDPTKWIVLNASAPCTCDLLVI